MCVCHAMMLPAWFVSLYKIQLLFCPTFHIWNKGTSNTSEWLVMFSFCILFLYNRIWKSAQLGIVKSFRLLWIFFCWRIYFSKSILFTFYLIHLHYIYRALCPTHLAYIFSCPQIHFLFCCTIIIKAAFWSDFTGQHNPIEGLQKPTTFTFARIWLSP